MTKIRTFTHPLIKTKKGEEQNGFLIPIYNCNDGIFKKWEEPQQVYITSVIPGKIKGPHLHFIRRGFFTCIKGNIKIILKIEEKYQEFFSGEDYNFLSVEVPTGIPAALQCIGQEEALVLNMPYPAWTPDMNDEYTEDFEDYFSAQ